jgi:hypothetical protein
LTETQSTAPASGAVAARRKHAAAVTKQVIAAAEFRDPVGRAHGCEGKMMGCPPPSRKEGSATRLSERERADQVLLAGVGGER